MHLETNTKLKIVTKTNEKITIYIVCKNEKQ